MIRIQFRTSVFFILLIALGSLLSALSVSWLWIVIIGIFLLVPGYCLLYLLQAASSNKLWDFLVSFCLGLSLLYINGLLTNTLIYFSIAEPLSNAYVLAFIAVSSSVLILLARNKIPKYLHIKVPSSIDRYNLLYILFALLTTALSIVGAIQLNNYGPPAFAIAATCLICITPLLLVLKSHKLRLSTVLIVIFLTSLSLLFQSSLRGNYVVGSDILNEVHVFNNVIANKHYDITSIKDAYNSCLSITLLPQIIKVLTGVDNLFVYKVIYQFIFSVTPLIVFCISLRFASFTNSFTRIKTVNSAVIATYFFMSFSNYINSMPNHMRQEIGFLFFAALILVLVSHHIGKISKQMLILTLGLSMIVSHYSTAYVAIAIFCIAYIVQLIVNRKIKKELKSKSISAIVIIAFIGFLFFWYSILSPTGGGPVAYINSLSQRESGEKIDSFVETISSHINIFNKQNPKEAAYNSFVEQQNIKNNYNPQLIKDSQEKNNNIPSFFYNISGLITTAFQQLYKFAIVLLLAYYILFVRPKLTHETVAYSLLWGCAVTIFITAAIPSFSVDYDQERLFQELLIILAIPISFILYKTNRRYLFILVACFLMLYTSVTTGLTGQVFGGANMPIQYNNNGVDYGRYYVKKSDVEAAIWTKGNRRHAYIYADFYGSNRLRFSEQNIYPKETLWPTTYSKPALVYLYSTNVNGQAYGFKNGIKFPITAPNQFLESNMSNVYTNGGSSVYSHK